MICNRKVTLRTNQLAAAATAVLFFGLGLSPTPCRGELQAVEQQTDEGQLTVFKMTVTPAPEPKPVLKHRLTLRELELQPGNAATHYGRAFPEGGIGETWKGMREEFGESLEDWYDLDIPLDKLPLDKARNAAIRLERFTENFIDVATRCRDCDWGHNIVLEMRGPEVYSFLLPEIQSMRLMSRALMLQARVAIADRDYDKAIDLLRMNYRMGGDVSRSPFIVSALVGIAICSGGNAHAVELIAAKDSPNLYWALAELPRPLVDLRSPVRLELSLYKLIFPVLDEPESANHTPDEWARQLAEALTSIAPLAGQGPQFNELGAQAALTGLSLVVYPQAKKRLVESGMSADAVERMPVGKVIAIDAAHEYRRLADEIEKWWYVPYSFARQRAPEAERAMWAGNKLDGGVGKVLAALLMPAMNAARNAEARLDWQRNAILTVEAIRMHAAEAGGLPKTLDEIKVVPMPRNPATGKSYQYRVEGETAVLELPFSDGFPGVAWRFEIKLAK
jgi:hypothetical protein